MSKIYIPIDEKSLFCNIYNDNSSGHTPTVCTPIKQGNSLHTEVEKIHSIPNHQVNFNCDAKLSDYLNKYSKSTTKITNVFIFDKLSVNGIKITNSSNYCIFIKEEIDSTKVQFGRTKLHYPTSIYFEGSHSFNNKKVLEDISTTINGYAFIVKGYFYDFDNDILDFDVTIVGYNQIPYSKVFISNKGTGNKMVKDMSDTFDNYDMESIAIKKAKGYDYVNPENYMECLDEMKKMAIKEVISLKSNLVIDNIPELYPYSLFDISYYENGIKRYAVISFSATKEVYFNFSIKQFVFINDFHEYVDLFNISDIYGEKRMSSFSSEDLSNFSNNVTSILMKK